MTDHKDPIQKENLGLSNAHNAQQPTFAYILKTIGSNLAAIVKFTATITLLYFVVIYLATHLFST